MDMQRILTELRTERDRLDRAINAIESLNHRSVRVRLRGTATTVGPTRRQRRMSLAARKRIGAAKKRWWAEGRKTIKK